ncbi:MAG TPA: MFS transporter [Bordetella sp.]
MEPQASTLSAAKRRTIYLLCFLAIIIDGFDTTTIAYVAPRLSAVWQLARGEIAPAFIATSIGAVIGYLLSGWAAARLGKRKLIAWSIFVFGVLTIATAYVGTLTELTAIRLFTAIALGFVVPAAISSAADHSDDRTRAAVTIFVTTGLSLGAAAGGFLAAFLMVRFDWQSVFITGGVLAFCLVPFVWQSLATDGLESETAKTANGGLAALFKEGQASSTILIWALAFVSFMVTYLFMFWVPTLLTLFKFSPSQAPLGSGAFGLGGVLGNLVILPFVKRYGPERLVIATSLLCIVCLYALAIGALQPMLVLVAIAGVGAGLVSACVSQSTLSVLRFRADLRTSAVGAAAAVGRIGSIVGPAIGGMLVASKLSPEMIMVVSSVPVVGIILILIGLLAVARPALPLSRQAG